VKVEVKKIEGNKREISIEVSGDIVKNKFEEVFKKISAEAKVPGFRPGNAPRDILEKHYSTHAQEQVINDLVPQLYDEAVEKEGLSVVELPSITDVKLDNNSLSFKAQVELTPEIKIKNYKGIKISYKKISASADEIKRQIDALKENRKAADVDDNFARGLGYLDLTEFQKAVERQICIQKDSQQRQAVEGQIVAAITKDIEFKLPQSLVNRQLQEMLRQAKIDLALKGLSAERIKEEEGPLLKELEPQAKNQVKVYLIFSSIAKEEKIAADESMPRRVMEFLLREADWSEAA